MSPRISEENINTQNYWDTIYGTGAYPTTDPTNSERYEITAMLQLGKSALDLGCGQGGLGLALAKLKPRVRYTGIDFSTAAIDSALVKGCKLGRWQDASVCADTVYLMELLEHVDHPSDLLAKAASLATKRMVVGVPRYLALDYPLHRGEHMWDFTTDELVALLSPYGTVGEPVKAGIYCVAVAVDL